MDWELSKENFQPLKRGRDLEGLERAAPPPTTSKTTVEQQRSELCHAIRDYRGDDPLEPWVRYIKWTQATFKAGGHQAELMPILERCTRELQNEPRYKNDLRYLRLWIQYADCLPDPKDVFSFLLENDIGQELSLFYIAYASYMELKGNFDRAEALYQAGLHRMALPLEKLRVKHDDFQERMARRRIRGPSPSTAEDSRAMRENLGTLTQKGREVVRKPTSLPSQRARGITRPEARAIARPADKENSSLEVFVDDSFQPGATAANPDAEVARAKTGGAWGQLSSFEATRKENEQRARFKGSKFKQNKALMQQPDPCLDIPEDEDLVDVKPVAAKPPKGTLRQRLETPDEALQKDPLRHFKDAAQKSVKPQTAMLSPCQEAREEGESLENKSATDQDDISFEEVRAREWLERTASKSDSATSAQPAPSTSKDEDEKSGQKQSSPNREPSFVKIDTEPNKAPAGLDPCSPERSIGKPACSPSFERSITLTAAESTDLQSAFDSERTGALQPPEMTVNTQLAFDSINGMFRGPLREEFGWQGYEPTATVRLAEPTVTMSTKAALEAVNGMFKMSLPHDNEGKDDASQNRHSGLRPPSARSRDSLYEAAGRCRENQTGTFGHIYEDTEFVSGARQRSREQTEQFALYEDTEFLPDGKSQEADSKASAKSARRPPKMPEQNSRADDHAKTDSFGIYQDTEFFDSGSISNSRRPEEATGTFQIYEDTNFL